MKVIRPIDFTNLKTLTIPEGNVTKITCGDEVLWEATSSKYTITYKLTNTTLSNTQSEVEIETSYTTTITTTNGHAPIVAVAMGGTDITNDVYDGNVTITIPSVTGNVVITVSETFVNLLPLATDTDRTTIYNGIGYYNGKRWSGSGSKVTTGNSTTSMTGFFTCKPGDILRIYNFTEQATTQWYIITFDDSQNVVRCVSKGDSGPSGDYESPGYSEITLRSAAYGAFTAIRLSWGQFNSESIVSINQEIL